MVDALQSQDRALVSISGLNFGDPLHSVSRSEYVLFPPDCLFHAKVICCTMVVELQCVATCHAIGKSRRLACVGSRLHRACRGLDAVTHAVMVGPLQCAIVAWTSDTELVCGIVGSAVVGQYDVRVAVLNQVCPTASAVHSGSVVHAEC